MSASEPLVEEIRPAPDPEEALRRFATLPLCVFFDSARRDPILGRYSFLAADPFDQRSVGVGSGDPLPELADLIGRYPAETISGLPPFQGGLAGVFSYDLGRSLERLSVPRNDEFGIPALSVGLYDVVLAWDHVQNRAWFISHGWPQRDPAQRLHRAYERLKYFHGRLREDPPLGRSVPPGIALTADQLAPQFTPGSSGVTSNFSRQDYLRAVARAIEYIRAGDIFQVNLSQRLLFPAESEALALYLRLRRRNPATFAGYFDAGDWQLASASPERYLQARQGEVEARPIKGTRPRIARPEADLFAGDDLRESEKDRAENVMIVDLLRNDLSRVCLPESVRVTQLCQLEIYEFVQHLVSAVRGRLQPGRTPLDLVRAAFPGGSITGAPKVRAMEIIAELEPTARGAYCGALAYLGFDGAWDSSILIRTITAAKGWWQFPVGGGIVSQSDPATEYEETWHKAAGLLRALR